MTILREAKGGRMNFCEFGASLIYIASSRSGGGYILRLCLKKMSLEQTFLVLVELLKENLCAGVL